MADRRAEYRILVGGGELMESDHMEDLRVEGSTKLTWICKMRERGGMDWIDLAQDRVRRRALVNAVIKVRVP
jgi:hypothetical protein